MPTVQSNVNLDNTGRRDIRSTASFGFRGCDHNPIRLYYMVQEEGSNPDSREGNGSFTLNFVSRASTFEGDSDRAIAIRLT